MLLTRWMLVTATLPLRPCRGLFHNGCVAYPAEESRLAEAQPNLITDLIREARQRLAEELRSQAEQLEKLEHDLAELRVRQQHAEQEADHQWEAIARGGAAALQISADTALENVLGAVRTLMTCTMPEQVLQVLTEEAARWGVRAAVFDVRGKAAWGASANGFGPKLTEKTFRSLIIPLNQENPFRQVCETAGPVDASVDTLKKNRNLLEKLKPAPDTPVLLLPIRSAGTVSAIFYADPGGKGDSLPVTALKILSEFAGAQLDRLIALSGGVPTEGVEEEAEKPPEAEVPVEVAAAEAPAEVAAEKAATSEPTAREATDSALDSTAVQSVSAPAAFETATEISAPPPVTEAPIAEEVAVSAASAAPTALAGFEISQLSEAEQKVHKDAQRFAKLLVSEIELYNKMKVADGRKNKDLYTRLKSDIDRSRQTFEKRFGKTLGKEFDYFHDELVKTLAANDSTVLGPEYPGPSA
jgi:hypothetical protein